jgi:hypothetical protein
VNAACSHYKQQSVFKSFRKTLAVYFHNHIEHANTLWIKLGVFIPKQLLARDGAVVLGTALQVGRSRVRFSIVSLDFFTDIILTAALWS